MMNDEEEFLKRYKLVCRECGSENVVIDAEPITDYGGDTGVSGGYITFGCNDCKKNDFHWSL